MGLNNIEIVITHVRLDGLPPGDVMSEMNIDERIQVGGGRRAYQRKR